MLQYCKMHYDYYYISTQKAMYKSNQAITLNMYMYNVSVVKRKIPSLWYAMQCVQRQSQFTPNQIATINSSNL